MKIEKHTCWNTGCDNEIPEPQYCCPGTIRDQCGCRGLPIHPPYCCEGCMRADAEQPKQERTYAVKPDEYKLLQYIEMFGMRIDLKTYGKIIKIDEDWICKDASDKTLNTDGNPVGVNNSDIATFKTPVEAWKFLEKNDLPF